MEIVRDEMGSEKDEDNGVKKCVNTTSPANRIKLDDIGEWLLVEVLIRLPVKLVFRSKLVCKQWLSVISDPSFTLMYVARASIFPHSQAWTYICHFMYVDWYGWDLTKLQLLRDIYSRGIGPPSLHVVSCPSAPHQDTGTYMVVGLSNGLVLYGLVIQKKNYFYYIANYMICNPVTGQWISLPPHHRACKQVYRGFVAHVENSVLKNYRVVRLNILPESSNVIRFEVFNSENGEWKNVNVHIDVEVQFIYQWNPPCLNGILHWITRGHGLIAYDPYHNPDSVRFIALPRETHPMCKRIFYVHQGRLRYFKMACTTMPRYEFANFSVWVLNDYNTGDWSLQHRIIPSDILYDGILPSKSLSLEPLSFHPFDSDIVYLRYNNAFVSYNIKTRKLEAHGGPRDVEVYANTLPFFPCPLVIPPWPIYISPPPFGVEEG